MVLVVVVYVLDSVDRCFDVVVVVVFVVVVVAAAAFVVEI